MLICHAASRVHDGVVRTVRVRDVRVGGWIAVPHAGIGAVAILILAAGFELQGQQPGAILAWLHRASDLIPGVEIAHQVQALTALYGRHRESQSYHAVGSLFCDHRPLLSTPTLSLS